MVADGGDEIEVSCSAVQEEGKVEGGGKREVVWKVPVGGGGFGGGRKKRFLRVKLVGLGGGV